MTNPPKKKGTAAETTLRSLLEDITGREFRRTEPGCKWDLETADDGSRSQLYESEPIRVLATRPDRGEWLLTMTPDEWMWDPNTRPIHVEVKRYARFALHTIWERKFGSC